MIRRLASHAHAVIAALILTTAGPAWAEPALGTFAVTVANSLPYTMTVLFIDDDPVNGRKQERFTVGGGQSRQVLAVCEDTNQCASSFIQVVGTQGMNCGARLTLGGGKAVSVGITKNVNATLNDTWFKCDFQGAGIAYVELDYGMLHTPNGIPAN